MVKVPPERPFVKLRVEPKLEVALSSLLPLRHTTGHSHRMESLALHATERRDTRGAKAEVRLVAPSPLRSRRR